MRFRDILAIITSQAAGEHVIAFAEQLARQNSGRVSGIVVNWQPTVAPVDGWMIDPMYGQVLELAHKELKEETAKVKNRFAKQEEPGTVQSYLLAMGAAGSALGLAARHADAVVVAQPTAANADSAHVILESVMFDSGRPAFIIPKGWKGGEIGRSVLIAWKPTREAARSLADAEDFIAGADRVSIVTVDANPSDGYSEQPGADIAAHLAYRGAKPDLYNLDSAGRTETKAILDQAVAVGADLVVMGGYGRSRMREIIFGGVTRDMLKTSTLPMLMSH